MNSCQLNVTVWSCPSFVLEDFDTRWLPAIAAICAALSATLWGWVAVPLMSGITGGVGQYVGQTTKALGAKTVVGIARNQEKLNRALKFGADYVINSTDKDAAAVSKEFRGLCKDKGLPVTDWKIFEVTGAKPGQEIALNLLSFTGKLIVVGFGLAKTEYSIGRLMAFDAEIIGTWGCLPEYYPIVLGMVLGGKINIRAFVETRPMSSIMETFVEAHKTPPMKRIVLTPDF